MKLRSTIWEIESGPEGAEGGFEGAVWSWSLRRSDGARSVVFVRVSGSALEADPAELPPRLAETIRTHGRSEVEAVATGIDPPRLIAFDGRSPTPRRAIGALAA